MSKNALITGSSHGIGAATAIALAKEGYNVGITYCKNPEGAKQIQAQCLEYGYEKYGEEGLREYLTQFTLAFHVPLLAAIKEKGLTAIAEYMQWLYETEEAPDALSMEQTEQELLITIHYCPAVKFLKSREFKLDESYEYCTSMVYEALAEASGLGFEMIRYDPDTGAAQFRFFTK